MAGRAGTATWAPLLLGQAACGASPPGRAWTAVATAVKHHLTVRQLHWIVENGLAPSGMPSGRNLLNDEEMWRIVLFLRQLPPPGSLGEPAVYGDLPP